MMTQRSTAGFSAIELLITLFIAAAFLTTGYQLYSIVIKSSATSRSRAQASNIAYDALRRYSAQATNPCTVVTPTPTPTIPANPGITNAAISVSFSCPYGTTSPTSKIRVTVTYGTSGGEVDHALLVTN
jgi:Tfp pilus assembly protein PilV